VIFSRVSAHESENEGFGSNQTIPKLQKIDASSSKVVEKLDLALVTWFLLLAFSS
jgi:hypothetical protein